jgi:hypothetical protein
LVMQSHVKLLRTRLTKKLKKFYGYYLNVPPYILVAHFFVTQLVY